MDTRRKKGIMENQFGFVESGDEQQTLFDAIPGYELGETPEGLCDENPSLYRCVVAKRGLLAAYEEAEIPTVIVDLLADLRHLCDALKLDFGDLDRVAHGHYTAEL
jgi:hypothetical protein